MRGFYIRDTSLRQTAIPDIQTGYSVPQKVNKGGDVAITYPVGLYQVSVIYLSQSGAESIA